MGSVEVQVHLVHRASVAHEAGRFSPKKRGFCMRRHLSWTTRLAFGLHVVMGGIGGMGLSGIESARAATWTNPAGGLYSTAGNWSGGVPNSVGAVADFSTLNTNGDVRVEVTGGITVGSMLFGDTDNPGSPSSWELFTNLDPLPTIVLNNGGATPTITVNPLGVTSGGSTMRSLARN
jgi:hypothetical protein